jgi:hypothetical protein
MAAKPLITKLKSMEEATEFLIERISKLVNMSCDTVEHRYDFISFILLKESTHDVTETGDISRI